MDSRKEKGNESGPSLAREAVGDGGWALGAGCEAGADRQRTRNGRCLGRGLSQETVKLLNYEPSLCLAFILQAFCKRFAWIPRRGPGVAVVIICMVGVILKKDSTVGFDGWPWRQDTSGTANLMFADSNLLHRSLASHQGHRTRSSHTLW